MDEEMEAARNITADEVMEFARATFRASTGHVARPPPPAC